MKHVDGAQNPLTKVVESIEDEVKGLEPLDAKLWLLDAHID